jgi:hypothetical protein
MSKRVASIPGRCPTPTSLPPLLQQLGQHEPVVVHPVEVAVDQIGGASRPRSVHLAALDAATEHEHRLSVPVVHAAGAVLFGAAPAR